MSLVALVLLAPVLPLQFPLLNLRTRDCDYSRCESLEPLEWRFCFLLWHAASIARMSYISGHDPEH
jgi:hypothetical protein